MYPYCGRCVLCILTVGGVFYVSLLWEVCYAILRIVQHKIFFIVGAVVILAVIGLLIFGIVMIKRGNSGGSGQGP